MHHLADNVILAFDLEYLLAAKPDTSPPLVSPLGEMFRTLIGNVDSKDPGTAMAVDLVLASLLENLAEQMLQEQTGGCEFDLNVSKEQAPSTKGRSDDDDDDDGDGGGGGNRLRRASEVL